MEVPYVPWIWQWFSILYCQTDTSRVADLGHSKASLPAGGELVSTFSCQHSLEHPIVHLELFATHGPLMITFERLAVPCILNSRLPSSLIDEVDIFMTKLVLRGFVVCLDTKGAHGDFWARTASTPYTMKNDVSLVTRLGDVWLPYSAHRISSIHFLPSFFKPS
jgi:hypothetical protein